MYGEGVAGAFRRLIDEIYKLERCVQDVRHTDPRDDKKRIEGTKGVLLADSYRWVLDNATFQQWQQDPHSRLLWILVRGGKETSEELSEQEAPKVQSGILSRYTVRPGT